MFVKKVFAGVTTLILIVGGLGSVALSVVLVGGPPPVPDNQLIAAGAIGITGLMALIVGIIEVMKR